MVKTTKVGSLSQYVDEVCQVREQWTGRGAFFEPWFRGVRDASWLLAPSLYRLELADDEDSIRADFVSRGTHLVSEREPRTDWEWYFLMQHFGAPTRLLDWSTGALVALFFAINSYLPGAYDVDTDAAVWMLDPWWLNGQVLGNQSVLLADWPEAAAYLPPLYGERFLRRRLPVAIEPPHVARRVAVQRSRFTIHGTRPDGLEQLARRRMSRIRKIIVPQEAVLDMRTDLLTCGFSDTTLFPDLEGLGREVARFYSDPTSS